MKKLFSLYIAAVIPLCCTVTALASPAEAIAVYGKFFAVFIGVLTLIYLFLLLVGWIGKKYGKFPPKNDFPYSPLELPPEEDSKK